MSYCLKCLAFTHVCVLTIFRYNAHTLVERQFKPLCFVCCCFLGGGSKIKIITAIQKERIIRVSVAFYITEVFTAERLRLVSSCSNRKLPTFCTRVCFCICLKIRTRMMGETLDLLWHLEADRSVWIWISVRQWIYTLYYTL